MIATTAPLSPSLAAFPTNGALLQARAEQAEKAARAAEARIDPKQMQAIEKTAKDFEGMFLAEMLSHMFSGLDVDPQFGGGHGEQMFRSLMIQEYGKNIAENGGLGIAAQVKNVMIAAQAGRLS